MLNQQQLANAMIDCVQICEQCIEFVSRLNDDLMTMVVKL